MLLNGGHNRARTCDPLLVRQVLSQLSYAPVTVSNYTRSLCNRQARFEGFGLSEQMLARKGCL
jgi:hypothetical protein